MSDGLRRGYFIALEGTDGSGKTTQFSLLKKRLERAGYDVMVCDFPQYDSESSYFVRRYLNGDYGDQKSVGPYTASLFFALDRFEASKNIQQAIEEGKIVLANRFTGSNMAHQGTVFDTDEELRGYFLWLDQIEYEMLKIPRPDISLILRVPAETAQKFVDKKDKRIYTDKKRDLHEADIEHMKRSVEVYDMLSKLFPKDFKQIDCTRNGDVMSIEQIEDIIWKTIEPHLPMLGELKKKIKKETRTDNKFLSKVDGFTAVTGRGVSKLDQYITDDEGDIYSFFETMSPQTIAAAMARLSRRGDDLRITLLDEFVDKDNKDVNLIRRVLTNYGDDSVQQLLGQYVVVENASNLLTKKIERSRLGAYLEQSTRYIFFDQKDPDGKYKYFVPREFSKDIREEYCRVLDEIFDTYSALTKKLTKYIRDKTSKTKTDYYDKAWLSATKAEACDLARNVLPVATKSTVGIYASAQTIENMIIRLISDELLESRQAGAKILDNVRKVYPAFYEKVDMPDKGIESIKYLRNTKNEVSDLSQKFISHDYSSDTQPISMVDFWPKNELDIVSDIVYENSTLSLSEINKMVDKWTINKRRELIDAYIGDRKNRRHKPGRALEKLHYSFDIICDYGIFRDLQRHRMVDSLEWQDISPRFGYDVPETIEQAGLSDQYEKCFDESLKLYSLLQQNKYPKEAQYACLLGHKMRWKITINARQAFHMIELRTSKQGHPGYRKLMQQMYELISDVHPLIAKSMNFVDLSSGEELKRLNSEKNAIRKASQL